MYRHGNQSRALARLRSVLGHLCRSNPDARRAVGSGAGSSPSPVLLPFSVSSSVSASSWSRARSVSALEGVWRSQARPLSVSTSSSSGDGPSEGDAALSSAAPSASNSSSSGPSAPGDGGLGASPAGGSASGSSVSSTPSRTVTIGDVSASFPVPRRPDLVPRGFMPPNPSQSMLGHLRFCLQKEVLGQDVFLAGVPGASRRRLVMAYAELAGREVEFVSVSRDTTDADLKQRRELVDGTAVFSDQPPVRAALHGRLLVIEGIEKAERNVLPTINNLLENREMALEDGRFLVSARHYDSLVAEGASPEDLTARGLVRVHPDFRVVAIGLSSPPYPGNSLDPPLRSRFQARFVGPEQAPDLIDSFHSAVSAIDPSIPNDLVGLATTLQLMESQEESFGVRLPHFHTEALDHLAALCHAFPVAASRSGIQSRLRRAYPTWAFPGLPGMDLTRLEPVELAFSKYGLGAGPNSDTASASSASSPSSRKLVSVSPHTGAESCGARAQFSDGQSFDVPSGPLLAVSPPSGLSSAVGTFGRVIETSALQSLCAAMVEDHAVGRDLCVIGPKGGGKSAAVRLFASKLGYQQTLFPLYADMSARDLLQRRNTDPAGNTTWEPSPLVRAALTGQLCVLDGVDRIPGETLATLARITQDREVDLFDGTRLVSAETYDAMAAEGVVPPRSSLSFADLLSVAAARAGDDAARRVLPIHPSFRIVALGAAPTSANPWLHPEVLGMFGFHQLPSLVNSEAASVLTELFPSAPKAGILAALAVASHLDHVAKTTFSDHPPTAEALSVSMRHLVRTTKHLAAVVRPADADGSLTPEAAAVVSHSLQEALLAVFLPDAAKDALNEALAHAGLPTMMPPGSPDAHAPSGPPRVEAGRLIIGDVSVEVAVPKNPELVPRPLYFDIPRHTALMRDMVADLASGDSHLLLIGNQGVGKNKLADRLLQISGREREYCQLHRDSTIQSLTLAPSLRDGVIVWDDSPLVRAVKHGRTLIVDEADKSPVEVVSVLKSLVEDGEMLLADGRRILHPERAAAEEQVARMSGVAGTPVIPIHPDFRLWVLANRPGLPFLGNAFFSACGDVFSSHVIPNPDLESEKALVRFYSASMSDGVVNALTNAFQELRSMNDSGLIAYPYSTRELVAIAKHFEQFPGDGVVQSLENVLAFDRFDPRLRAMLSDVFSRHGIQLVDPDGSQKLEVSLSEPKPLPKPVRAETWVTAASTTARDDDSDDEGGSGSNTGSQGGDRSGGANSSGGSAHGGAGSSATGNAVGLSAVASPVLCDVQGPFQDGHSFWRVDSRVERFAPEHLRTTRFTEEISGWSATSGPHETVLSSAVTFRRTHGSETPGSYDLHVLTRYPLSLTSFTTLPANPRGGGLHGSGPQKTVTQLALALLPWTMGGLQKGRSRSPTGWGGSTSMDDPNSSLAAVPETGEVAVILPAIDCVVLFDGGSRQPARVFRLPELPAWSPWEAEELSRAQASPETNAGTGSRLKQLLSTVVSSAGAGGGSIDNALIWKGVPVPGSGLLLLWQAGGGGCCLLDTVEGCHSVVSFPEGTRIASMQPASSSTALVYDENGQGAWLQLPTVSSAGGSIRLSSGEARWMPIARLDECSHSSAGGSRHSQLMAPPVLHTDPSSPAAPPSHLHLDTTARSIALPSSFLHTAVDLPLSPARGAGSSPVFASFRPHEQMSNESSREVWSATTAGPRDSSLLVTAYGVMPAGTVTPTAELELVDPTAQTVRTLPVALRQPEPEADPASSRRARKPAPPDRVIGVHPLPSHSPESSGHPNGGLVAVVTHRGAVRIVQTSFDAAEADLKTWKSMMGIQHTTGPLTYDVRGPDGESLKPPDLEEPKHGKEDEKNDPHVGGSTWAGGTGGSNTAGLGGRGGPYRLDKGHKVHQISEAKKAEVSEEVRERARAMAQEALGKRLEEISMTSKEMKMYDGLLGHIAREVTQLRVVLKGADSRSKERQWLRNQTQGDIDDTKLVDGATGERLIYKRRGEAEPNISAIPKRPQRLHFVLDCSGSMYRFNGQDGRLNRMLEAAVLIMESFVGLEHKFEYTITGHSGDSDYIPLVSPSSPPQHQKARLQVLETMVAHSQYCMSGDMTLEAARRAIKETAAIPDTDGKYVFVVSDANLRRYGIPPQALGRILTQDPSVRAYAIFIASLADETDRLLDALPSGRAFSCMDTATLVPTFRKVLSTHFGV